MTYRSIVVLTGAGISAESGIRTFRAADGLWEDHRIEDGRLPGTGGTGNEENTQWMQSFELDFVRFRIGTERRERKDEGPHSAPPLARTASNA